MIIVVSEAFYAYQSSMRVLGIDPGLGITGYGLLDYEDSSVSLVEAGLIRSDKKLSLEERLMEIATGLEVILKEYQPNAMAIEELYSHYNHPTTAIVMGHVRGVAFLKAAEHAIEVHEFAATRVKKSLTGNGRATKLQVQYMVQSALKLSVIPEPADAADALAIAMCHCNCLNREPEITV